MNMSWKFYKEWCKARLLNLKLKICGDNFFPKCIISIYSTSQQVITPWPPNSLQVYTVGCHYNVVQYNKVQHSGDSISDIFTHKKNIPYLALSGEIWDVYCEFFCLKFDSVITAPHCISPSLPQPITLTSSNISGSLSFCVSSRNKAMVSWIFTTSHSLYCQGK